MFAGFLCFKGGVHAEQIGLIGHLGDGDYNSSDVLGLGINLLQFFRNGGALISQVLHDGFHFHQTTATGGRKSGRILGHAFHFAHGVHQLISSHGNLTHRRGNLRCGRAEMMNGGLLLLACGVHFHRSAAK